MQRRDGESAGLQKEKTTQETELVERSEVEQRAYNVILEDLGALGYGLAGVVDDRVGVAPDGASDVIAITSLHGLAHRRPEPRHLASNSTQSAGTGAQLNLRPEPGAS